MVWTVTVEDGPLLWREAYETVEEAVAGSVRHMAVGRSVRLSEDEGVA